MAQHQRRRVRFRRPGLVVTHADAVDLGELRRGPCRSWAPRVAARDRGPGFQAWHASPPSLCHSPQCARAAQDSGNAGARSSPIFALRSSLGRRRRFMVQKLHDERADVTAEHQGGFTCRSSLGLTPIPPASRWDAPLELTRRGSRTLLDQFRQGVSRQTRPRIHGPPDHLRRTRSIGRQPRGQGVASDRRQARARMSGLFFCRTRRIIRSRFSACCAPAAWSSTIRRSTPRRRWNTRSSDSETDILITLDLAALYPQMSGLLGKDARDAAGDRRSRGILRPSPGRSRPSRSAPSNSPR